MIRKIGNDAGQTGNWALPLLSKKRSKKEVTKRPPFLVAKGTVVVMDRGYVDYKLFARWTKGGIFFVARLKENANYWDFEDRPLPKSGNVLKDQLIRLNPLTAGAPCQEDLRLVTVWDERNQCEVRLLTNHLQFAANTIAAIYRERWQIELFFKALKQNLKIKTFVRTAPMRSVSRFGQH